MVVELLSSFPAKSYIRYIKKRFWHYFRKNFRLECKHEHSWGDCPGTGRGLTSCACVVEEMTKDPEVKGFKTLSEFGNSSLSGHESSQNVFLLCFGAFREGRMVRDQSLLTS